MTLKVVVTGAMGRMGQALIRYALDHPDFILFGATERHDHPMIGQDIGRLMAGNAADLSLESDLRRTLMGANAIVDFTEPEGSLLHLAVAAEQDVPIVIGTTGFNAAQLDEIRQTADAARVVLSPNMSVGVNLMWKLAARAAKVLGDQFDAEIVEVHHRNKADAPSGTALRMAQAVAAAWDKELDDCADYGRSGNVGRRERGRIGLHAVRGGDIVGEHRLSFFGPGEEIFVGHRATSRENFVKGAYRAAQFLQNARPGLYSMMDVLGL